MHYDISRRYDVWSYNGAFPCCNYTPGHTHYKVIWYKLYFIMKTAQTNIKTETSEITITTDQHTESDWSTATNVVIYTGHGQIKQFLLSSHFLNLTLSNTIHLNNILGQDHCLWNWFPANGKFQIIIKIFRFFFMLQTSSSRQHASCIVHL